MRDRIGVTIHAMDQIVARCVNPLMNRDETLTQKKFHMVTEHDLV